MRLIIMQAVRSKVPILVLAVLLTGACLRPAKKETIITLSLRATQSPQIEINHFEARLVSLSITGITPKKREELVKLDTDTGQTIFLNKDLVKFKLEQGKFAWLETHLQLSPRASRPALVSEGTLAINTTKQKFKIEIYEPISLTALMPVATMPAINQENTPVYIYLPVDRWFQDIPPSLWTLASRIPPDSLILISPTSNKDLYLLLLAHIKASALETTP